MYLTFDYVVATLPQQLINGMFVGSIYALIALGYTMVYGVLGLINFAHGEVVMVGAMISVWLVDRLLGSGLQLAGPIWILLAMLVAMLVCASLSAVIERGAYRPLRRAPRLAPLITAIGVSWVLQILAKMAFGAEAKSFPPVLDVQTHHVFNAIVTNLQLMTFGITVLAMTGLWFLVERTRLGRAMRATAENPAVAQLMGVNTNRIITATFMLGGALAAVAGVLFAANYQSQPTMGLIIGLKAFSAAVLGGIGNIAGAMLGGFALGIIESLGAGYLGPLTGDVLGSHYQDIFAFLVLILMLVFRPSGLLGERVAERA